MEGTMLVNTQRSRLVRSTSYWTYLLRIIFCKTGKLPLHNQDNIREKGKGLTASMSLRTKITNKKQKSKFAISDNSNQDFREFLKKLNISPYLGYNSKQVHSKPTEAYIFLIKQITCLIKRARKFD